MRSLSVRTHAHWQSTTVTKLCPCRQAFERAKQLFGELRYSEAAEAVRPK